MPERAQSKLRGAGRGLSLPFVAADPREKVHRESVVLDGVQPWHVGGYGRRA